MQKELEHDAVAVRGERDERQTRVDELRDLRADAEVVAAHVLQALAQPLHRRAVGWHHRIFSTRSALTTSWRRTGAGRHTRRGSKGANLRQLGEEFGT